MIFVVLTDFNGWAQTRVCLERLRASSLREFTALVVDHGTTDETAHGLRASYPEAIRVKASPELWWTGATNAGIRAALARGAERVVLLNNDCYVTPDTLATLVEHARGAAAQAIIAPLQRSARDHALLVNLVTTCFLLGFPTLRRPWPGSPRPGEHALLPVPIIIGG